MGIALSTPATKTVTAKYDEAWVVNIQSASNPGADLFADSVVTVHRRERTVYSDGSFDATNAEGKTEADFVPQHSFKMSEAVARSGVLTYKDKDGTDKTIPESDVALIVRAFLDRMGAEARLARAAELAAMEET